MADQSKMKKAWDYTVILIVFAVTGSTAAIFPRWIMPLTGLEPGTFWYVFWYILMITPIYQVLLLGYAFVFGKFQYFYQKQKKLVQWIGRRFAGCKAKPEKSGA
jgi:hypothetical protein